MLFAFKSTVGPFVVIDDLCHLLNVLNSLGTSSGVCQSRSVVMDYHATS